jgi:hypothetical protein
MDDPIVLIQINQVKRGESPRDRNALEVCQPKTGARICREAFNEHLQNLQGLKAGVY